VTGAPNNILFPAFRQHRKADCQHERAPYPINLTERLKRIKTGLDDGMTPADVQHEYDAQQAERVIQHWVRKLADNPRRGPSDAAAFLGAEAGRLYGDEAS
jgi:hypothetical protein